MHFAITWRSSDGRARCYQNGELIDTSTVSAGLTLSAGGSFYVAQDQSAIDTITVPPTYSWSNSGISGFAIYGTELAPDRILAHFVAGSPLQIVRHEVEAGTVALYQLNGAIFPGYSDYGPNNLVISGGVPVYNAVTGTIAGKRPGTAAYLTDAGHGSRPGNDGVLTIAGALTIMCMIKRDPAIAADRYLVIFTDNGATESQNTLYGLHMDASHTLQYTAEFGVNNPTGAAGPAIPASTWTHVAVTRSAGGSINFYIDGALATGPVATTTPTGGGNSRLWVGRFGAVAGSGLRSDMGSLRISNTEYTAGAIAAEAARLLADWRP